MHEHFAIAYFSEAVVPETKSFFQNRIPHDRTEARNPRMQPPDHPTAAFEAGLTSKTGTSGAFQTNGLALLDTGASRSVIGEENVPCLMDQLPKPVRSRVKERASRVAFRFGNNQIEYSYKL